MTVIPLDLLARSSPRLHEAFLERAAQPGNGHRAQALGAFLTLRLVDRLADDHHGSDSDAVRYQLRAAGTYLDELYPQSQEVSHLREIVRVATSASQSGNRQLVWPPLLAFAYWLEQQVRLAEALDVLDTALQLANGAELHEKIATYLQRGRVLRLSGRFPDSQNSYAIAGEMANLSGDWRSEMVSRIGRASILQETGDLPLAERELRAVLAAAQIRADSFVEARASHDLAVSMHLMSRRAEAVALAFRAFQLYEEPVQSVRALHDTGVFLKELGHYSAAREAFLYILEGKPSEEARLYSMLSLFDVAWLVGDRVGFQRWKREMGAVEDRLLNAQRVDYHMSAGQGLVSLGDEAPGIEHLERALALAEEYRLSPRIFAAEQALAEAKAGKVTANRVSPAYEESLYPELKETVSGVFALRASR